MWRRNNMVNNPGEINKADIEYAVRKFLHDAHDYANTDEYKRIKGVMTLMFLFYYVRYAYFNNESFELFTPDPNKTPETELDYIPPKKQTKKRTPKETKKQKK